MTKLTTTWPPEKSWASHFSKPIKSAPIHVAHLVGRPPVKRKVASSIPSWGVYKKQPIDVSHSLSFPPFPLAKNKLRIVKKRKAIQIVQAFRVHHYDQTLEGNPQLPISTFFFSVPRNLEPISTDVTEGVQSKQVLLIL